MLLILDRRIDMITPMLSQWTYQAMVHELLGIQNGRVDLSNSPDKSIKDIILSTDNDPFYKTNIFSNFGDLGSNIKSLVTEFQQKTKSNVQIESIADMKRFIEDYPEFKKLSGNVSKHVALVGELSRLVDKYKLLQVSELEQNISCLNTHATDYKELMKMLEIPDIEHAYKIRLAMIYFEKYGKNPLKTKGVKNFTDNMRAIVEYLKQIQVDVSIFDNLCAYEDLDFKKEDLQSGGEVLGIFTKINFKTAENVYTQHVPLLSQIIDLAVKGRLKESNFGFLGTSNQKINEIIVFFVNGVTYEEAKWAAQFNANLAANGGTRVIVGGTSVHNFESFCKEIKSVPA